MNKLEIKHPYAVLTNGDKVSIWFMEDGKIHFWDDVPGNFPQWTKGTFDSREEAETVLTEMLTEGWIQQEEDSTTKVYCVTVRETSFAEIEVEAVNRINAEAEALKLVHEGEWTESDYSIDDISLK